MHQISIIWAFFGYKWANQQYVNSFGDEIRIKCTLYFHLYCKSRCFWRNSHRWQKFYPAAGSDGMDKSHLQKKLLLVEPRTEGDGEHLKSSSRTQNFVINTLIFQTNAVEQLLWRWQCDKPNNGVGAKKAAAAISGR